jgi:hypothetical protein
MAFPNALLAEQPNSPSLREDEAYKYVTRTYQVTGRLTENELISNGYLPEDGYVDAETDATYIGYEYESAVGYPIVKINFRYRKTPDAIYDCHNSSFERPIENHNLFLMKWKYYLLGKVAKGTTALPAFAATATDFSDLITNDGYMWSTSTVQGDYKYIWQEPTKPGVNSYLYQTTLITKRKVYTEIKDAAAWHGEVGFLCAPLETYGIATDKQYWLIRDVRIVEDSDLKYAVTVEFLFADFGWDTDIYTDADIEDTGIE